MEISANVKSFLVRAYTYACSVYLILCDITKEFEAKKKNAHDFLGKILRKKFSLFWNFRICIFWIFLSTINRISRIIGEKYNPWDRNSGRQGSSIISLWLRRIRQISNRNKWNFRYLSESIWVLQAMTILLEIFIFL